MCRNSKEYILCVTTERRSNEMRLRNQNLLLLGVELFPNMNFSIQIDRLREKDEKPAFQQRLFTVWSLHLEKELDSNLAERIS